MKIVCVVLAGGEGRRMGGAKPLQPFGGGTLISQALHLARRYADDIAIVVREPAQVADVDARVILDDPTTEGPLGGLSAALAHAQACEADAVLTLPCDTPNLPGDLAQRLVSQLADSPSAGAAVATSGGRLHPVCALWRASLGCELAAYLADGARSVRGFAQACGAVTVDWAVQPADPFANANTPEQLAKLQPRADTRS